MGTTRERDRKRKEEEERNRDKGGYCPRGKRKSVNRDERTEGMEQGNI